MGCRLWETGKCTNSAVADYCQDGADFKCPLGYKRKNTNKNTLSDSCEACPAGQYCSNTTSNTCDAGYICLE